MPDLLPRHSAIRRHSVRAILMKRDIASHEIDENVGKGDQVVAAASFSHVHGRGTAEVEVAFEWNACDLLVLQNMGALR